MTPYDWKGTGNDRRHWFRFVAAMIITAALALGVSIVIADAVGADDTCTYTVQPGDTLYEIGVEHDTTWQRLAANNRLVNAHLIYPGDTLQVCSDSRRPSLVAPPDPPPGDAVRWAVAVASTAPETATPADIRLLVALAGPESAFCEYAWNVGDSSADGRWIGSLGCVQIRVLANPPAHPATDWYRSETFLDGSLENQARAAWIVYGAQGREAWGPARPGRQLKLVEGCEGVRNRSACEGWWSVADMVLG